MTLFVRTSGGKNSYLIAPDSPGNAILIDPFVLDVPFLELIERNGLYVRSILLTHPDEVFARSISTISKVYDVDLYAAVPHFHGVRCGTVTPDTRLTLDEIELDVFGAGEIAPSSVIYGIGVWLFTGDLLEAGGVEGELDAFVQALVVPGLRDKLADFPPYTPIFPHRGPPSTVEIERRVNSLKAAPRGD